MKRIVSAYILSGILSGILLAINFGLDLPSLFAQSDCKPWSVTDGAGVTWRGTLCSDGVATPTATPTPVGAATLTPTPINTPQSTVEPPAQSGGLWFSAAEAKAIPMAGSAWAALFSAAESNAGTPDLSNQDSSVNVAVLADALVWARTDDPKYRQQVAAAIKSIVDNQSESGGRTLALGRELGAYIAAADLIDLRTYDPALHNAFKLRLKELRNKTLDGMTLVSTHERRPNNWGTMAGASRAAIDVYIEDVADLQRTAQVFNGWLGNRTAYASFTYGDLSWQCNSAAPVGINPTGCMKSGQIIDGAIPDDMRRGGSFKWPPSPTGYAWGSMSGTIAQAEILHRAGFMPYEWNDRAILRAAEFLKRIGWQAEGDDAWAVAVINKRYGTNYPVNGTAPGKNFGWSQWTHGALVQADMLAMPAATPEVKTVIGDSLADLADEVAYLAMFGWLPVGEPYQGTNAEGDEIYAQVVELGR